MSPLGRRATTPPLSRTLPLSRRRRRLASAARPVLTCALAVALATGTGLAPASASIQSDPSQGQQHNGGHHGKGHQQRVAKNVTIKRDNYGVPHVYAPTVEGLYTGYGYAVAQDRLFQMEMAKRSVLGTASEVMGPETLANDKRSRESLDPESIRQQIDQLSPEDRAVLRGYARGYNRYVDIALSKPQTLLPRQFHDAGFRPSHFSEYDVAMIWIGTMANRFSDSAGEIDNLKVRDQLVAEHGETEGAKLFDQLVWKEDPSAPTTVPREQSAADLTAAEEKSRAASALAPVTGDMPDRGAQAASAFGGAQWPHGAPEASNMWIVGSKKAAEGGSTLMNGPQFDWFNPSYVYGIGLHGAGIDVTGNTPFGYPSIIFGTNKDISWGATAGPLDVNDIYQEQLDPQRPSQYSFNGAYRPMAERTETIKVKGGDDVQHTVRSTVHGTVIAEDPQHHTAYSKKRAWKGTEVQSLMAWVNIMKAKDWDDYLEQAKKVGITINWYYADKRGNIGYVSPGRLPVRPANQDFRLPAAGDGSMEWQGFRPFSENPRTYNPKQGYIANWNNQSGPGFNSDVGNWSSVDRVHEITERLESREKLSAEQIWGINEQITFADLNIRYLRPYLERAVSSLPQDDPLRQDAERLIRWNTETRDRNGDGSYDAPEATVMRAWLPRLTETVLRDDLPSAVYDKYAASVYPAPDKSSVRPAEATKLLVNALKGKDAAVPQSVDFFNGRDPNEVLRSTLRDTLDQLRSERGTDESRWLTPVAPSTFKTKNFMGVPQADPAEEIALPEYMNRGTQNDIVHLSRDRARMCVAAPPGQSGFVAPDGTRSPHYADQLELYTSFQCKEENLYRHQVARNLESVTHVK